MCSNRHVATLVERCNLLVKDRSVSWSSPKRTVLSAEPRRTWPLNSRSGAYLKQEPIQEQNQDQTVSALNFSLFLPSHQLWEHSY